MLVLSLGTCYPGFECRSEDQCLPVQWKCDGQTDCRDGSDEQGCADGETRAHDESFFLLSCLSSLCHRYALPALRSMWHALPCSYDSYTCGVGRNAFATSKRVISSLCTCQRNSAAVAPCGLLLAKFRCCIMQAPRFSYMYTDAEYADFSAHSDSVDKNCV